MRFYSKNQKIWFVSDLHAMHDREFITHPRGHKDLTRVQAYEQLIKTWNEHISKDDIVFNLGDMICGAGDNEAAYVVAIDLISRLNGRQHYYIFGNHNSGMKDVYAEQNIILGAPLINRRILPLTHNLLTHFTFLGDYAEITIDKQQIVLSHYPIARWHKKENGSWNIHGHTHGTYDFGMTHDYTQKQLDVGWGVNFNRPVEYKEIVKIMDNKK